MGGLPDPAKRVSAESHLIGVCDVRRARRASRKNHVSDPARRSATRILPATAPTASRVMRSAWIFTATLPESMFESNGEVAAAAKGQAALPPSREASLRVVPQLRVVMPRPLLPRIASPALLCNSPPAQ